MNDSIYKEVEEFAVPLPITQGMLAIAQRFASEQPTEEKADRVRSNTLAVLVVNDYLQWLGIETDVEASDSWNSGVRLCADVADLDLPNLGRLECRPITQFQTICSVPSEVLTSRIGYVVVQLDEANGQAHLLGFTPSIAQEALLTSQLQPAESFIDHLQELKQTAIRVSVQPRSNRIKLGQWWNEIWETGWQAVETLLNSTELTPAMSFRSNHDLESIEVESSVQKDTICQAKLIDLGMQLAGCSVVLIVEIGRDAEGTLDVVLQVHPCHFQAYLPPDLQLLVLDDSETVFMEVQSRSADNYIQLQFSGKPGESFSVKVALGEASITENFEI
jgi:Protein of unknown function (DUF1822)